MSLPESRISKEQLKFQEPAPGEVAVKTISIDDRLVIDSMDTITGVASLGDAGTGLAVDISHKEGSYSVELDKVTHVSIKVAGISKAVDLSLSRYNKGKLHYWVYLSSLTDVSKVSLVIGTSSSHCITFETADTSLSTGWNELEYDCDSPTSTTGNGCLWGNVDYISMFVTFDASTDLLADMRWDAVTVYNPLKAQLVGSSVTVGIVDTELPAAGTLSDNTSTPTCPAVGAYLMAHDGTNWDMARGDSSNGLLINPGSNNDIQIKSGQVASGAISSGAIVSGAIAAGAIAAGAAVVGSFLDGSHATIGVKADAAATATDTTEVSAISLLKQISKMEQAPASRAVTGAFYQVTQPVSEAAPVSREVTGNFYQVTQPISEAAPASRAVTNAGAFAIQQSAATPFYDGDVDNTKQALKVSAGILYKVDIINPNAVAAYLHFYNTNTVTVGTTAPNYTIMVPAQGAASIDFATGNSFDTYINYAATNEVTGAATDPTVGLILSATYI